MQEVKEYIVSPFPFGEFSIDAIWIDGKPFFQTETIAEFLQDWDVFPAYQPGYIREHFDEIELPFFIYIKDGKIQDIGVYDLTGFLLIVMKTSSEPAVRFKKEITRFIERHWEDVPEKEG